MPKREALERRPSTGNVFVDLGLPDATNTSSKRTGGANRPDIRQRKLTQAAGGHLMGIDQPKISAMLAGQFGYSVERPHAFFGCAGHDVEIV